uniref:Uncharacterized protein n=1 Tax=Populus trichocarpa TaxID=3694 RepID=A0A3N7G0X4_POPTR
MLTASLSNRNVHKIFSMQLLHTASCMDGFSQVCRRGHQP